MDEFQISTPVEPGVTSFTSRLREIEVDLTNADADDLNAGLSITTLTTSGEEIALFPED